MKKRIALLGSTGSIGTQALKVIASHPDLFQAVALAAGDNFDLLLEQTQKFKPEAIALKSKEALENFKTKFKTRFRRKIPDSLKLFEGNSGLVKIATLAEVDLVLVAIPGVTALKPTIAAIKQKKDIAIASKEILVAAGEIVRSLAKKYNVQLLPVDSEHSALAQCLKNEKIQKVKRFILTASGGPFWSFSLKELRQVTLKQALKHPTWKMGRKVTIDSATLMNKGFEVIEAHYLFGLPYEKIEVLIHPESIVHSMVEFIDGSVLAQLAQPDMTLSIQYALADSEHLDRRHQTLGFEKLTFLKPDLKKFPALALAYEAGRTGGTTPAVLNAANEVAVELFLKNKLGFVQIPLIVKKVLEKHRNLKQPNLVQILEADRRARIMALEIGLKYGRKN